MKTAYAFPDDDTLKVIRYLVKGARLTGTVTRGEMTEYTLNTIGGDITVIMPSHNVWVMMYAFDTTEEE
jgi:hypothetical protein